MTDTAMNTGAAADPAAPTARVKYAGVNGKWPDGTRDGRDLKPTAQEAIDATRRLYRKFAGKTYRGEFRPATGNRRSYPRFGIGIYRVNPDFCGGGWHEVVHFVSHVVALELYGEQHGPRHAFIEKEMIDHVVTNGWHIGALRRPDKPKPDPKRQRFARIIAAEKRWQAKKRRAENALKKIARQRRYYEGQGIVA